jgi:molecular chaperone GrpE
MLLVDTCVSRDRKEDMHPNPLCQIWMCKNAQRDHAIEGKECRRSESAMTPENVNIPEPVSLLTEEPPPSEFVEESAEQQFYESTEQQLLTGFADVIAEVAALRQTVETCLLNDKVTEEAFDRLYVEVEEVRQERGFQQVRPLFMDLILLYDRIELGIQQMSELEASMPDVVQLLKSFRDELIEILYRREIETIVTPTTTFDRTLQQAVSVQPTGMEQEHNQVVRVVRRGFRYRNRILRSEEVIVRSYKAT